MVSRLNIFTRLMQLSTSDRQTLISFSSYFLLTAFGFLGTMYFAHLVGPSVLGIYFIFLALFNLFDLFGNAGLGGAAVKRISEGQDINAYFSAFLSIRILFLISSVLLVIVFQSYFPFLVSNELLLAFILCLILGTIFGIISSGIYGAGMVGVREFGNMLNFGVRTVVQIIALYVGFALFGLIGGFCAGLIAAILLNYHFFSLSFERFKISHIKSLFGFAFWIFLASGSEFLYNYVDTLLIGYFMTSADVGIYRIVFQLTALVTISVMAIQSVIYPKISNWYANNEIVTIQKTIKSAFSFSFLFAIPVCIGGWLLGDYLLYFLYGSSFESGDYALLILFATQIACIFMLLFTCTLNATDQPKKTFFIALMSGIVNISLNVILIPVFGIVGAAIASLVSMCLNAFFAYIVLTRKVSIILDTSRIGKVVIASMVMGIWVFGYRLILTIPDIFHLIFVILIGACIYLFILLKIDKELFGDCQKIISHFLA